MVEEYLDKIEENQEVVDFDSLIRKCNGCGLEKPLTKDFFYPKSGKEKNRFRSPCIDCTSKKTSIKNKEKRALKKQNEPIKEKVIETHRTCRGPCKQNKPLTEEYFYFHKKENNTFREKCIECFLQEMKDRRTPMKTCKGCGLIKANNKDNFEGGSDRCTVCINLQISKIKKNKIKSNRKVLTEDSKRFCKGCNSEKILKISFLKLSQGRYGQKCIDCVANKDTRDKKEKRNDAARFKRKNNPFFKLKSNVSRSIREMLKTNKSSKNGRSCLKYLQYTMKELKEHIESQFESWMNWDNQGFYIKKAWDSNDPSTWKWQVDHIIPQAELPYSSMEDENFKKCWALENLRPLNAKNNLERGLEYLRLKRENV